MNALSPTKTILFYKSKTYSPATLKSLLTSCRMNEAGATMYNGIDGAHNK